MEAVCGVPAQTPSPDPEVVLVPEVIGENHKQEALKKKNLKKGTVAPNRRDAMREITDRDVLSGRGGCTNSHAGNRLYRRLVRENQPTYKDASASASVKNLLAVSIIEAIKRKGGRFMQRDPKKKQWVELSALEARNKTTQALRGEVYLKNPGEDDVHAKKRPEPGSRSRASAAKNAAQPAKETPTQREKVVVTESDNDRGARQQPEGSLPREQLAERLSAKSAQLTVNAGTSIPALIQQNLYQQNVRPSLLGHSFAHGTQASFAAGRVLSAPSPGLSEASTRTPIQAASSLEDKRNLSPAPKAKSAADKEGRSILLEALAGMTGKSLSRETKLVDSLDTNKDNDVRKGADGLMSLAAIAGMLAERDELLPSSQACAATQQASSPEATVSASSIDQPKSSDIPTFKEPMIPQAIVAPPMGPPTIALAGSHLNQIADFKCALVQYNLAKAAVRKSKQLEHRNWGISDGMSIPPSARLLLNPLAWHASHPSVVPGVGLGHTVLRGNTPPLQAAAASGIEGNGAPQVSKVDASSSAEEKSGSTVDVMAASCDDLISSITKQDDAMDKNEETNKMRPFFVQQKSGKPPKKRKIMQRWEDDLADDRSKKQKLGQGRPSSSNSAEEPSSGRTEILSGARPGEPAKPTLVHLEHIHNSYKQENKTFSNAYIASEQYSDAENDFSMPETSKGHNHKEGKPSIVDSVKKETPSSKANAVQPINSDDPQDESLRQREGSPKQRDATAETRKSLRRKKVGTKREKKKSQKNSAKKVSSESETETEDEESVC